MLRINQITLSVNDREEMLGKYICAHLGIGRRDLVSYSVYKRSIDARKKDIKIVYTVDVVVNDESKILSKKIKDVSVITQYQYTVPPSA